MDDKRKKIYISIIVFCLIGMGLVFLWSSGTFSFGTTTQPNLATHTVDPNSITIVPSDNGQYPAPPVFPTNPALDLSVLNSSFMKATTVPTPLILGQNDLGRTDPFSKY